MLETDAKAPDFTLFDSVRGKDSVASHAKFAEKYDLPFVLLSDPERAVIEASECGRKRKCAVRFRWVL